MLTRGFCRNLSEYLYFAQNHILSKRYIKAHIHRMPDTLCHWTALKGKKLLQKVQQQKPDEDLSWTRRRDT